MIGPLVLGQPSGYNLGVHFMGSISVFNFGLQFRDNFKDSGSYIRGKS